MLCTKKRILSVVCVHGDLHPSAVDSVVPILTVMRVGNRAGDVTADLALDALQVNLPPLVRGPLLNVLVALLVNILVEVRVIAALLVVTADLLVVSDRVPVHTALLVVILVHKLPIAPVVLQDNTALVVPPDVPDVALENTVPVVGVVLARLAHPAHTKRAQLLVVAMVALRVSIRDLLDKLFVQLALLVHTPQDLLHRVLLVWRVSINPILDPTHVLLVVLAHTLLELKILDVQLFLLVIIKAVLALVVIILVLLVPFALLVLLPPVLVVLVNIVHKLLVQPSLVLQANGVLLGLEVALIVLLVNTAVPVLRLVPNALSERTNLTPVLTVVLLAQLVKLQLSKNQMLAKLVQKVPTPSALRCAPSVLLDITLREVEMVNVLYVPLVPFKTRQVKVAAVLAVLDNTLEPVLLA